VSDHDAPDAEQSSEEKRAEQTKKEIAYYKRRIDELAGENLNIDYQISGLRHELKQKRQGFALLSELQLSIGAEKQTSSIFEKTIGKINATLGMDRTAVLVATDQPHTYRPAHWTGFPDTASARLASATFEFPPSFADGTGLLLVHKKSETTPLAVELQTAFELPGFICLPVMGESGPIGLLLSGRIREAKPLYPPLDQGDVDTFTSIAGLISTVVKNMRIAVLEEMDRLKTDFFANISHEFRTPITLTLGPLEGIRAGRYGEVPEAVRAQISVMQRSQNRLLGLVNQILDLAKLEAGKLALEAVRVNDMNRFIEARVAQFRSMAEKRELTLDTRFDPAVQGADLYLDLDKLDKVVFNLLSNAHKFTKQGRIEVRTEIAGGVFRLVVKDTGIGIKADQLPAIFDRFRQADGSASREYAGTGIGLALVKEVIELHGGEVTVHSEYGKGTTFTVSIPLGSAHLDPSCIVDRTANDDAESETVTEDAVSLREGSGHGDGEDLANATATAARDSGKATVLYVDDNGDLREYVRDLLAEHYNVFLAVNGKDGLDKALLYKPDLILSDLMMPVMTGAELCKHVRQTPELKGLPFVLLTAKSTLESKVGGLEEGADDYLTKPFAEAELLARIKNLVSLRKNQARLKGELLAARAIQQSLLPASRLAFDRIEIDALYHPSEELSGDFYDVIETPNALYFYLADVTSHGTAAAQVTYLLRGIVREALAANRFSSLSELMVDLNTQYARAGLDYDVATQLVRLDTKTAVMEYVLASAPPALLVRDGAKSILQAAAGAALSARPLASDAAGYEQGVVSLKAGDHVYFFTDGAYEFSADGRPFGRRRLYALLESANKPSWRADVLEAFETAKGGSSFEDDVTLLRLSIS
jgi:signal transduction histidine kinase/DNA-binding response OmpR family regulator